MISTPFSTATRHRTAQSTRRKQRGEIRKALEENDAARGGSRGTEFERKGATRIDAEQRMAKKQTRAPSCNHPSAILRAQYRTEAYARSTEVCTARGGADSHVLCATPVSNQHEPTVKRTAPRMPQNGMHTNKGGLDTSLWGPKSNKEGHGGVKEG